ncbi:MAG: transcriptional regulator [Thiothrix sp.]|nr:MAG: transcriptional regulator [Thiothrix sp.]
MEYNVYASACPTRMIFDRLSDKWTLLILDRLREQPVRFNQLLREIDGISQKMLSQTLKNLERDGLVNREAFPTVPVTVEYSITALGKTLSKTVGVLIHWAQDNGDAVLAAQASYDKRMAS